MKRYTTVVRAKTALAASRKVAKKKSRNVFNVDYIGPSKPKGMKYYRVGYTLSRKQK